jgi:hypothetical protein
MVSLGARPCEDGSDVRAARCKWEDLSFLFPWRAHDSARRNLSPSA